LGISPHSILKAVADRRLPHFSVHQIGFDDAPRRFDASAMGRQKQFVMPVEQLFQRRQIVAHIAFGRSDNGRVPAHHMIA